MTANTDKTESDNHRVDAAEARQDVLAAACRYAYRVGDSDVARASLDAAHLFDMITAWFNSREAAEAGDDIVLSLEELNAVRREVRRAVGATVGESTSYAVHTVIAARDELKRKLEEVLKERDVARCERDAEHLARNDANATCRVRLAELNEVRRQRDTVWKEHYAICKERDSARAAHSAALLRLDAVTTERDAARQVSEQAFKERDGLAADLRQMREMRAARDVGHNDTVSKLERAAQVAESAAAETRARLVEARDTAYQTWHLLSQAR